VRSVLVSAGDARVQSAAHRAAVDAALATGTAEARVLALRAIGRTRRAEFLPTAVASLSHLSIDVRREAAFAVAHIGSGAPGSHLRAQAALAQHLGTESDPFVTASLAESIGRLSFDDGAAIDATADLLTRAWSRIDAGPARTVVSVGIARGAEALARRARSLSAAGVNAPRLVALLETLLDRHARPTPGAVAPQDVLDRRVRRMAMASLTTLRALSPARRATAASDVDAQVRRLAVLGLASGTAVTEADARAALADDAMLVRHAAVARLGPRLPTLAERAATDAHVAVRLAALDALGEARACRAVCLEALRQPHTRDSWHQAAHALVALARTDADAARPHVLRATASDIWQVRAYTARAAGLTAQGDVVARLAADANPNVQHAALVAWRQAALPNLAEAAVSALASDDGQLVLEAATALQGAAAELVPRPPIVAALRTALARLTAQRRETSRDPRVALLERIDELDPERATTLRPYLADFDPFVAERTAALLAARGVSATASPARLASAIDIPAWDAVEALGRTTVRLTFSGNRTMVLRLYAEQAPTAVARFVAQVRAGDWNGRTFHRVEPGFVVQGGSPAANEYAGAAAFARDEFSALSHVRGTVGISTRGPDTGDGQIFINLVDNVRLDFGFTIVGSMVGDPSLIDDIVEGEVIVSATTQ
jgi:cyclophilin family peptidyl-prolyl cis-trans isomerase